LRGRYMFKRGHVVTLGGFVSEFVEGLDEYLYKQPRKTTTMHRRLEQVRARRPVIQRMSVCLCKSFCS
jgi:hypothetical protein